MKFANIRTLKFNTAELLRDVEDGEQIVITYHGKPRAMLVRIGEGELVARGAAQRAGVLTSRHPFLKLIGKAADTARDVSANKYRYLSGKPRRRR